MENGIKDNVKINYSQPVLSHFKFDNLVVLSVVYQLNSLIN